MFGVSPKGPPGKREIHGNVLLQTGRNIVEYFVHAGHFHDEFPSWLQARHPMAHRRLSLPNIQMFQHMNRCNPIHRLRRIRQGTYVGTDIRGARVVNVNPAGPPDAAASDVEGQPWMTRLHALATILGSNRCEM